MVAARKKLTHPLKKVVAAVVVSPKITLTTLTLVDAAAVKATTTSTISHKVASTMPSSADTAVVPTTTSKQPRPSTKTTGDVAQPSKRVKKTA